MDPHRELVDLLRDPVERYRAQRELTGPGRTREKRGRPLAPGALDAVIWGLGHESPVVRRGCLEILDLHPDPSAVPHIVARLSDPVPRVRWHAVHALICDACKPGHRLEDEGITRLVRERARNDPNPKVRREAERGLAEAGLGSG